MAGAGARATVRRAAAVVAAAALLSGCLWTSYGGNLANTRNAGPYAGISPANAAGLTELWRVGDTHGSTSTPAVFAGVAYFGGWDGTLRAVSTADGSAIWTTPLSSAMVDDSPLLYGPNVYIGDGEGFLHAVDKETGAVVWSEELDPHPQARIFSSPVGVDGLVIVGVASTELALVKPDYTFRGSVVALDAATGAERWRLYVTEDDADGGAGVSVWSTVAVDTARGLAFIGTGQTYEEPAAPLGDSLLAIDYRSGELVWSRQFTAGDVYTIFGFPQGPDADIGAAPNLFTIDGQDVVGVGDKAGVYAVFDRDTGEEVWARELPTGSHLGGIMTTAAYHDGVLYLVSNQWANFLNFHAAGNVSTVFALDAATGATVWSRPLPSSVFGAVTHVEGLIFVPSIKGTLYALDASDGSTVWSAQPGGDLGSGVSVVAGRVYVPYGFWFFIAPANPVGGVVAYALP